MESLLRDISGFCAILGFLFILSIIIGLIATGISFYRDRKFTKNHPEETLKKVLEEIEYVESHITTIKDDIKIIAKRVDKSQRF